jgi:hypothetical protein
VLISGTQEAKKAKQRRREIQAKGVWFLGGSKCLSRMMMMMMTRMMIMMVGMAPICSGNGSEDWRYCCC